VSDAARRSLTDRILALAKAHDVLVAESWAGADIGSIVGSAVSPFVQPGLNRIQASGPAVRLSPQQAVTMALLLHELTTNAVKHGALSNDTGTIELNWNLAQDGSGARYMTLLWRERGGPTVRPSPRRGFGSRLLARGFTNQEGGRVSTSFPPEGAQCVIELKLSRAEEVPYGAASALDSSAAPPPAEAQG
jgi:two-component sensor histidine kinase